MENSYGHTLYFHVNMMWAYVQHISLAS